MDKLISGKENSDYWYMETWTIWYIHLESPCSSTFRTECWPVKSDRGRWRSASSAEKGFPGSTASKVSALPILPNPQTTPFYQTDCGSIQASAALCISSQVLALSWLSTKYCVGIISWERLFLASRSETDLVLSFLLLFCFSVFFIWNHLTWECAGTHHELSRLG